MMRSVRTASVSLVLTALVTPALAGMTQDLADCTATDKTTSAAACTRVMESGRLWENQHYIGHYNRGWSYFNAGDYDKALADFDRSIKLNPGHADTYLSRALARHMLGARVESAADLDLYLEKKGETAEARINRARLFLARKEPDRAFSEAQSAAAVDPDDHRIEALRALALADLGELAPARIAADKAIAMKPAEAGPYYARAVVAHREGKRDEAGTDVEKALSIRDRFVAAHTLKGKLHEEKGETDAAVASFRRAVEGAAKAPDAIAAQAEARERLAALTGEAAPARVAASFQNGQAHRKDEDEPQPRDAPRGGESDCRRFIPAAGTTVAVDCSD